MLHNYIVDTVKKWQHVLVHLFRFHRVYLRSMGLHNENPHMVYAVPLSVIFYQVPYTWDHLADVSTWESVSRHQFLDISFVLQVYGVGQSTGPIYFEMVIESYHGQSLCEANNHELGRYFEGHPYSVVKCRFLVVWHRYCTILTINALFLQRKTIYFECNLIFWLCKYLILDFNLIIFPLTW